MFDDFFKPKPKLNPKNIDPNDPMVKELKKQASASLITPNAAPGFYAHASDDAPQFIRDNRVYLIKQPDLPVATMGVGVGPHFVIVPLTIDELELLQGQIAQVRAEMRKASGA